eukprot:NODE_3853_length_1973_cov_9.820693.p1 GENE.NODE_3853_length_1973_cov_9.820693~~NODE_3853_length_1973_cov_9.820693.p1  ORF type:complete len:435 (-),score=157.88 NODE_3853_length_1973_cov_9.820693:147-1451(-)
MDCSAAAVAATAEAKCNRSGDEMAKLTLVMSHDNILALAVITLLSILGAIYLWKICTRKHCACRICRNQYREIDLLGSGGYGNVYLVKRMDDGAAFVSKKIPVGAITELDEYSREAKDLVLLRHRHIVSYEDDFVHIEYTTLEVKTYIIIIMEYCPEGDLKQKIEHDFHTFTEEWVCSIFAQLLDAVQYLHSKNVIHRDLKSQNIFFAHDGRVRLGDFGLCRHTHKDRKCNTASLTHAGTDCYMAPEMLASSRYGKPADIWSLGCILYELCTGQFMWELDGMLGAMVIKDTHIVQKLLTGNIVPVIGQALQSLTRRLLARDPSMRPSVTECLRRRLFKRCANLSKQSFGEFFVGAEEDEEQSRRASYDEDIAGEGEGILEEDDEEDEEQKAAETSSDEEGEEEEDEPVPVMTSRLRAADLSSARRRRRKRASKR